MIWKRKNAAWRATIGPYHFRVREVPGGFELKYNHIPSGRWDEIGNNGKPWRTAAIARARAETFARVVGAQ